MSRPPAESSIPAAQSVPAVLDAVVLAHGGLSWEGEFSGTRFTRLHGLALSDTPQVQVRLAFALLDKRPVLHGELRGEIELMCQRCMQPMRYPLNEQFDLMLVEGEAELERVPETHEPWVANALRLKVFELVEEQLLLALPLIAKHEDETKCLPVGALTPNMAHTQKSEMVAASDTEVLRPFGNLRDLMRK